MRSSILFTLFWILAYTPVSAQLLPNMGGQRAGLSALSFLKNDMSPRALAMGGTATALPGDAYNARNNPAGLATLEKYHLAISNLSPGAGFQQSFISSVHKLKNEASLAFSLNSMYTGSMKVRTEFQPDGTGEFFALNNTAVGVSYATRLSDMFSLGITMNYLYEAMASYRNHTVAADIGFLYHTDFKDLRFAVLVQNFGGNSALSGSGLKSSFNRTTVDLSEYTVPTVFKMGFSMVPIKDEHRELTVSAELNHPNDNAENLRFGLCYAHKKLIEVMAGYKLGVQGQSWPSGGIAFKSRAGVHPLKFYYAVNPTNHLGTWHMFGIAMQYNNDQR